MTTVTKKDVEKLLSEIRTMKIKYCVWCKAAQDTAQLWKLKCKTRNLLGQKVQRHVFRVKR